MSGLAPVIGDLVLNMGVVLLIFGILLFVGLILVHEWGHFIAARRSGVDVEEFGLGFPPRIKVLTTKNKTEYTLNWLPFGGFVRLKGEHDADSQPHSYGGTRLRNKVKIMMAGVTMNVIVAFVILTYLAATGMPQLVDKQFSVESNSKTSANHILIGYVEPDSPASQAGIQPNDRIEAIGLAGGPVIAIKDSSQVPEVTKQLAGQKVTIAFKHNGEEKISTVTLRDPSVVAATKNDTNPKGYLGISPTDYQTKRYTWAAPLVALGTMWQFTVLTFQGLWHALSSLFTGHASQASAQVAGPIGVFVILEQGTQMGLNFVLVIIAIISLTLAIMNALPIPALDGGRLFVTLLYRVMHKPLSPETEDRIHGTAFMLLLVLIVVITVVDVRRFILN